MAIRDESDDWIAQVKNNNEEDFQSKMAEFNAKLNAVREHRLQERAEQRKRERRDKWLRNKAEEERRRREEEERLRQQQADAQRRAGREARVFIFPNHVYFLFRMIFADVMMIRRP